MARRILAIAAVAAVMTSVPLSGTRSTFIPDWTFKGSTLAGWHVLGDAEWRADNGELVGTPKSPTGGWLVLDKGLQDFQFGADFLCASGCKTGVLVRAEKLPDGGMKGVFIPLVEGEVGVYSVTLDASGRELTRERQSRGIGNMVRFAPSAEAVAAAAAARAGGPGRGAAPGGAPAGAPGAAPGGALAATAPGAGRAVLPGRGGPGGRGGRGLVVGEWNDLSIIADANTMRPIVNGGLMSPAAAEDDLGRFGPVALYVGGTAPVHYRDVSYKDVTLKRFPKEELSAHFRMVRVNPFYYSFSAAGADVDRDGHLDFISGPFIYFGPDFTKAREFYAAETSNPSTQFSSNWLSFAGDFTGDGWPDILLASTSGSKLYVNPKGEARRWDVYSGIIPPGGTQAEVSTMKDVDGDGVPDLVYANPQGGVMWAKPDPANPTGMWIGTTVGGPGTYAAHGIGAGDVNGDGRVDILNATGWWEQPAKGTPPGPWAFHPGPFGRGGAEMAVYDVNGDKLNDVVTSVQAHNFGLAWYEQTRDASGAISFVEHVIFDNYATAGNAGGVAFSELHGSTMADVNGDAVPDFLVGKRYFSHHESFLDPDPYGAPVLYAYLTVRDPKAPGRARFQPELIHNQSGAGSQVLAMDMDKDGTVDVMTSTVNGSYMFFGKPRK